MLNGLPERTKDATEVELICRCWYHKKEKAAISNLLAALQSRAQTRVCGVALPLPASSGFATFSKGEGKRKAI
jgi:hypothetical protein